MSAAVASQVLQHGLRDIDCDEGLWHTAMLSAGREERGQMAAFVWEIAVAQ